MFNLYKLPNFIFGPIKKSGKFWSYKIIMRAVLISTDKLMRIFE
jgi:hypothetical protein